MVKERVVDGLAGVSLPAVHFSPMPNSNDGYDEHRILDLIEDAVVPLAHAVLLRPAELLNANRAWLVGQRLDAGDDAAPILAWDVFDFLSG